MSAQRDLETPQRAPIKARAVTILRYTLRGDVPKN